jgi:APA family basic amino acid/polyamine antiporter
LLVLAKVSNERAVIIGDVANLRRELGLGSAIAAVVGESIAIGIFMTPAGMAKALGSPFWLLFVWTLMAAMALSGALCFGELATRFPEDGGLYVYLREAYGKRIAFLYGWMCLLVMDPGITAALAVGMATYASYVFGWSSTITKSAAIATLLALGLINIVNLRISAGLLRVVTWLKFGILGVIVLRGLLFGLGAWRNFVPFVHQRSGSMPLFPALAVATVAAFFSFGGWWDVSKIAGEVKNPERVLPRALVAGVLCVSAVYIFITGVFLYLVPLERVSSDQGFVTVAGEVLFGAAGARVLSGAVVVCVLGSVAVLIMVAPRVYYAMSRDGLFFSAIAVPHPKFRTPSRAILLQVVMASVLVGFGSFNQIISYFIFAAVVFLGLTVSTIFRFRRWGSDTATYVGAAGYPYTPIFFIVLVVVLLGLIVLHNPWQALIGVAVVAAGLPVYALVDRSHGVPAIRGEVYIKE